MYTGFYMPNGTVPPGIAQNGKRAQDAENFISNNDTELMYMYRLMDLAMSVFKWKGLPDGVDERQLEFWLLRDGFVGFFYDADLVKDAKNRAPEGYAVLPLMVTGQFDIYNVPISRTAYAVNGLQYQCDEDNSVIIFNNYLRVPMWSTLLQYAHRLANVQRTIDVNIAAQKTPKVIRCGEKQRLTLLNFAAQVDEGKPWIYADKNLSLDDIVVLDTSAPMVVNDLQRYKGQIWNEILTYLGIENVNTDKKERLISDEVVNNMGAVESERFTRLNARKQACNQINDLFGLHVSCEFRSGVYIRTGSTGNAEVQTSGMQESNPAGNNQYAQE